jgi:mRNA interferase RelE/StbE
MNYSVSLAPSAEDDLARLHGQIHERLQRAIDALVRNPRPRGCLKLAGLDEWRIRVGHYRIRYVIDDSARRVIITRIGHRSNVYD